MGQMFTRNFQDMSYILHIMTIVTTRTIWGYLATQTMQHTCRKFSVQLFFVTAMTASLVVPENHVTSIFTSKSQEGVWPSAVNCVNFLLLLVLQLKV